MSAAKLLTKEELDSGFDDTRRSPEDEGRLLLIVRRPQTEEREILERGQLEIALSLVGDNWKSRRLNLRVTDAKVI